MAIIIITEIILLLLIGSCSSYQALMTSDNWYAFGDSIYAIFFISVGVAFIAMQIKSLSKLPSVDSIPQDTSSKETSRTETTKPADNVADKIEQRQKYRKRAANVIIITTAIIVCANILVLVGRFSSALLASSLFKKPLYLLEQNECRFNAPIKFYGDNGESFMQAFFENGPLSILRRSEKPNIAENTEAAFVEAFLQSGYRNKPSIILKLITSKCKTLKDKDNLIREAEAIDEKLVEAVTDFCAKNINDNTIDKIGVLSSRRIVLKDGQKIEELYKKYFVLNENTKYIHRGRWPVSLIKHSRPGFSADGTMAVIYNSYHCGPECGNSQISVFQMKDGKWIECDCPLGGAMWY